MPNPIFSVEEVEKKIGLTFRNKQLLSLAFTHRSYWNEHRNEIGGHNERLEFLGDSILGLLLSDYLYRQFPDSDEGELSSFRALLVSASACATYTHELQIDSFLLLGKGEQLNLGKGRESIQANLFEALVGALYLDRGFEGVQKFLFAHLLPLFDAILATPARNWKAELQDWVQKKFKEPPLYEVVEVIGPDHSKQFRVQVRINGEIAGEAEGSSKKEAQMRAAEAAFKMIEEER